MNIFREVVNTTAYDFYAGRYGISVDENDCECVVVNESKGFKYILYEDKRYEVTKEADSKAIPKKKKKEIKQVLLPVEVKNDDNWKTKKLPVEETEYIDTFERTF